VSSVPAAPGSPPVGSTVTILFSDIRGFTEYTDQYGDEAAFQVLQQHNEVVQSQIEAFSGKVVKTQGDSFMVAFTTARGAVLCAAAIQRAIAERTHEERGSRIAVGIGINTGEPIYEGGDFFGSTVNLASRVCASAGPGQILVAETTRHVAGRLDGIDYIDRGLHELKGFQDQQRLFEVSWMTAQSAATATVPDEAEISAVEGAVQRALGVLNRVLAVGHRDDPAFHPLLECQAKASELRLALSRAVAEQRGYTVKQVDQAMLPFADLLTLVTGREHLDDQRWGQLEMGVSRAFGRPLVAAATRGRLVVGADREPPKAAVPAPPTREPESPPRAERPRRVPMPAAAAPLPLDPRAQTVRWWMALFEAWQAWKASGVAQAHAVRAAIARHPYVLGVPLRESPDHDGGRLVGAYFALLEHVEDQSSGFVRTAVDQAVAAVGPSNPTALDNALYGLLVGRGRLRDTYADFVRDVMIATIPMPGPWVDAAVTEREESTSVVTRPSASVGDPGEARQELTETHHRAGERRFAMTVAPLTARFFALRAVDIRNPRDVELRLTRGGEGSDHAWSLQVRSDQLLHSPPRRLNTHATTLPGLGRNYGDLWIGVFNPDPAAAAVYELAITIRVQSPPGIRRSTFSPLGRGPR
jgi:class 3 adenylate cyclase